MMKHEELIALLREARDVLNGDIECPLCLVGRIDAHLLGHKFGDELTTDELSFLRKVCSSPGTKIQGQSWGNQDANGDTAPTLEET